MENQPSTPLQAKKKSKRVLIVVSTVLIVCIISILGLKFIPLKNEEKQYQYTATITPPVFNLAGSDTETISVPKGYKLIVTYSTNSSQPVELRLYYYTGPPTLLSWPYIAREEQKALGSFSYTANDENVDNRTYYLTFYNSVQGSTISVQVNIRVTGYTTYL